MCTVFSITENPWELHLCQERNLHEGNAAADTYSNTEKSSTSLFISASLHLPYKQIHQYHFSRFHVCTLKVKVLLTQQCRTLWDPMECSSPGSSLHGIFPGKNTGVGCHFLLQGVFPIQVLNLGLLHWKQILYHLSHQELIYNICFCHVADSQSCIAETTTIL